MAHPAVADAGTASATVQAAIAKDATDWTLDEQKAVAEDIAAKGEASPASAKATTDKLFLLSRTELDPIPPSSSLGKDSPWLLSEGFQYEAFKDELTNTDLSGNPAIANGNAWWQRSIYASGTDDFYLVNYVGFVSSCSGPSEAQVVCPAFCF